MNSSPIAVTNESLNVYQLSPQDQQRLQLQQQLIHTQYAEAAQQQHQQHMLAQQTGSRFGAGLNSNRAGQNGMGQQQLHGNSNVNNQNAHLFGLSTQQLRNHQQAQHTATNGQGQVQGQNGTRQRGNQQMPRQVTHLHHAQGIAAAQVVSQSPMLQANIPQNSLQQVGAQIISSNGTQNFTALMNQIGGMSIQAAQAQSLAQAQAIINAQTGGGGAIISTTGQIHHVNPATVHQLAQAQYGTSSRAQQIVGQLQSSINNQNFHQYSRQLQQQYASEADDSGDLDSESEIHGKNLKNGQYTSEEDEFEFPKLIPIRASTAPPRPLTEIEEFRRSSDFLLLENTVMMSDHLKQRPDEKYDLDSEDGQRACKRFLNQIERLCERFKAICATRKYREQFSKAYKVLYKEGSLCYLTEILDSAQEGFPYLWVNGEKYVFSQDVLEAGRKLFQQFKVIQQIIRNIYERIMEEVNITVQDVLDEMGKNLQDFDHTWVAYEQIYVLELMLIEADARRFITEAIDTEKDLSNIEQREKTRGRIVMDTPEYNNKRAKLIQILGKINSVANPEGMGRDDLTNDILMAAEGIFRRVSPHQSKAVRALAERIKKTFADFRTLLKKYEQNIEVVDPQLKNNVELVEILVEFENTWTQGLTYFMDSKKCHQLIHFSSVIEATGEKHKQFAEQLESREAEIFFIIPSLLILKSLEGDDKDICSFFNPDMFDKKSLQGQQLENLRQNYEAGRKKLGSSFDYYNLIEKCLLEVTLSTEEQKQQDEYQINNRVVKEIKGLAMCLSRFKPADWNKFLDVVIK